MERSFFEIDGVIDGIDDEVGVVEEVVEDGNRFLDFIFMRGRKMLIFGFILESGIIEKNYIYLK